MSHPETPTQLAEVASGWQMLAQALLTRLGFAQRQPRVRNMLTNAWIEGISDRKAVSPNNILVKSRILSQEK